MRDFLSFNNGRILYIGWKRGGEKRSAPKRSPAHASEGVYTYSRMGQGNFGDWRRRMGVEEDWGVHKFGSRRRRRAETREAYQWPSRSKAVWKRRRRRLVDGQMTSLAGDSSPRRKRNVYKTYFNAMEIRRISFPSHHLACE